MKVLALLIIASINGLAQLNFGASSSDRVMVPNFATNMTAATVYAWVYPTTLTAGRIITMKGYAQGYWKLNIPGTPGRIRASIDYLTADADAQSVDGVMATGKWYFVAATFDGTSAPKLYLGDLTHEVTEVAYVSAPVAPSGAKGDETAFPDAAIGCNNSGTGTFNAAWQGLIHVVQWVPGTVLTLTQLIAEQHLATDLGSGFFGQMGGTNAIGTQADLSGGGHNGSVLGPTAAATAVPLGVPALLGGM